MVILNENGITGQNERSEIILPLLVTIPHVGSGRISINDEQSR